MPQRSGAATLLALALLGGSSAAKPTDVPVPPKVNGKVPPTSVQDFFTEDPASPQPDAPPRTQTRRSLPTVGDQPMPALADTPLENLERITRAGRFFELGEALREVGENKLATAAYKQAAILAPGSRYASMAEQRIETAAAGRIGGEVESEEPATMMKTIRIGPFRLGIGKKSLTLGFVIESDDQK